MLNNHTHIHNSRIHTLSGKEAIIPYIVDTAHITANIPLIKKIIGGIPYNAHGAQLSHSLFYIFCFVLFFCLFQVRLGQVKLGQAPQGQERGLVRAPQDQSPPQRLELEKKEKSKRGGRLFVLQEHNTGEYRKDGQTNIDKFRVTSHN